MTSDSRFGSKAQTLTRASGDDDRFREAAGLIGSSLQWLALTYSGLREDNQPVVLSWSVYITKGRDLTLAFLEFIKILWRSLRFCLSFCLFFFFLDFHCWLSTLPHSALSWILGIYTWCRCPLVFHRERQESLLRNQKEKRFVSKVKPWTAEPRRNKGQAFSI